MARYPDYTQTLATGGAGVPGSHPCDRLLAERGNVAHMLDKPRFDLIRHNASEFTVLVLAEKIISLTGSRSKIESRPLPADYPGQRQPDICLARKGLDWAPIVGLDEGLKKSIEYFDELLRSSRETSR